MEISEAYSIPIIYLSDLRDEDTLNRAKKTPSHSFLGKPVTEFALLTSIEFALKNHFEVNQSDKATYNGLDGYVFIREGNAHKKIAVDNILWLKADGAYCQIKTTETTFTQSKNMREVSEYFDTQTFVKVHKSYTVNMMMIDKFEGSEITIEGEQIPIGKTYMQSFKKKLKMI